MADVDCSVEYREIPGFPGYRVGNDGSVWSKKHGRYGFKDTWRKLKPSPATNRGYRQVTVCGISQKVSCLVMLAFVGPRPPGNVVRHIDGNRVNDSLINLRYGTQLQNVHDAINHGTSNPHCKLNKADVIRLRLRASSGEGIVPLAKEFGVSKSLVSLIIRGEIWAYVDGPIVKRNKKRNPLTGRFMQSKL